MQSAPRPQFTYNEDFLRERTALLYHRDKKPGRRIPKSSGDNIIFATWNLSNLGAHDRGEVHLKLIAEIISWFDLVSLQEISENYTHILKIVEFLGGKYRVIFSAPTEWGDRRAFIFNTKKVSLTHEISHLIISEDDYSLINVKGVEAEFPGFARAPYMVSFQVKSFQFSIVNAHCIYKKGEQEIPMDERGLKAYAVARVADLNAKSKYSYSKNVFGLGDFNLPKGISEILYKALVSKGLIVPEHSSRIMKNNSDDNYFDQIGIFPGFKSQVKSSGVFDFDHAIFSDIFQSKTANEFTGYLRYFISDHRPFWIELDV